MNRKFLVASLAILACIASISPIAQAEDPPEKTVQASKINAHDLEIGDLAPDVYKRSDKALAGWKQKGLKTPQSQSQWVQINDKYMMVQITNGQILDITPVER